MLTQFKIKHVPKNKKVGDGRGLYFLKVGPGRGRWTYRYMMNGRAREMGFGPFPEISLDEARHMREDCRRLQVRGIDPLEKRREEIQNKLKAQEIKFSHVASSYIQDNEASWTSRSRHQWETSLRDYVFPYLDKKPLDQLQVTDICRVLRPIWTSKTETASRIQQRMARIFSYAITKKVYTQLNPAEWQNNLENIFPAATAIKVVTPMRSLGYTSMPKFFAELNQVKSSASLALQFLILTAARTIEVTHSGWDEFDFTRNLWTIPAQRMKARREHQVPLSTGSLDVITKIKKNHNHKYIFAGSNPDKPLSNNVMGKMMRTTFKSYNATPHGFRSSFRNWAAETNEYDPYAVEFCLAHQIPNRSEAVYLRTSLLDKRQVILQDWSDFICSKL